MRGRRNPPLDLTPVPESTPLTFDLMAQAYLEDYVLQRYRTLSTARPRVEHLREFFGGWTAERITSDSVRTYQLRRRKHGAEAATVNRETSALSRMFQVAIRRGQLERMPLFPTRLEENPPREGFFEHDEYLKVRAELPPAFQDVLDFAYYSGWRRKRDPPPDMGRGGSPRGRDSAHAAAVEDEDRPRLADFAAGGTGPHTATSTAAGPRPTCVPSRRCAGESPAHRVARCVSEGQGPASAPARLSTDGGAEPDPSRRAETGRHAPDRP